MKGGPPGCGVYIYHCKNCQVNVILPPGAEKCGWCMMPVELIQAPRCLAMQTAAADIVQLTGPASVTILTPMIVDTRAVDALRDALEGPGLKDFDRVKLARLAFAQLTEEPSSNGRH